MQSFLSITDFFKTSLKSHENVRNNNDDSWDCRLTATALELPKQKPFERIEEGKEPTDFSPFFPIAIII